MGGQSGDPGTFFEDDTKSGGTFGAALAPRCTAPSAEANEEDDAGVPACDLTDGGGWDCMCDGERRDSDAGTCMDALHEQCGVPLPEKTEPECVEIEDGPAECRTQPPEEP